MRRSLLLLLAVLGLVAGATTAAAAPERVRPLAQAHAHNDYEHARPLFDALDAELLRQAGFAEAGPVWQFGDDHVLVAVR